MNRTERLDWHLYLAHLKALPFVRGVEVEHGTPGTGKILADALLRLRTPKGKHTLWVEMKKTHLTRTLVDGLLARMRTVDRKAMILFAPYVGPELGRHLRENQVNYVDAAGNCFLALDEDYIAQVEGRRPERKAPHERGVRGPGHQVLFALLARPALLNAPVRVLAEAAGVGKTATAEMLTRLESEGLVGTDRKERRLLQPRVVLDRWIAGYTALVRPRLLMGRFRMQEADPEALEVAIARELGDAVTWAWGGGAAAMRLTRHFRGEETILHLMEALPDLGKRLRAVPAPEGQLTVLKAPGRVAFEGVKPRTVHPLLVYTELLVAGHGRAREASTKIWDRHLSWLAG